jgi:hypothetical protein
LSTVLRPKPRLPPVTIAILVDEVACCRLDMVGTPLDGEAVVD